MVHEITSEGSTSGGEVGFLGPATPPRWYLPKGADPGDGTAGITISKGYKLWLVPVLADAAGLESPSVFGRTAGAIPGAKC